MASLVAVALLCVGCSGDDERLGRLKVYNWGDYIDEELLVEFEEWYAEQTGEEVEVVYQTFDINEVMLAKIENGHADFDVVCPSEYIIERMLRKELLLPILCGIFLMESVSVILQTQVYKFAKKKGTRMRVWKRTPLHDHYRTSMEQVLRNDPTCRVLFQGKGPLLHESKIVLRFCIVTLILAALAILTLKIR